MPQNSLLKASGGDYATLLAAIAAEEFQDYGEVTRLFVSGVVPAGGYCVFNGGGGRWPHGVEIIALAGEEYDGTNHATCATITHNSAVAEAADCHVAFIGMALFVTGGYNNEVFKISNTIAATIRRTIKMHDCYVQSAPFYHGSTFALEFNAATYSSGAGSQYHLDFLNVVVLAMASNRAVYFAGRTDTQTFTGTIKQMTVLPTNSGTSATNAFWIGGGNDCNVEVDKILSIAQEVRTNVTDYVNEGMNGTFTNISTNDGTGTVTGVTSATELENYAAGDYRLKATGSGNGAFPQESGDTQSVESTASVAVVKALNFVTEADQQQSVESTFTLDKAVSLVFPTEVVNEQTVESTFNISLVKSIYFDSSYENESTEQSIESAFALATTRSLNFFTESVNEQSAESSFVVDIVKQLTFLSDYENFTSVEQSAESTFNLALSKSVSILSEVANEQSIESSFSLSFTKELTFLTSAVNEVSEWSTPELIFEEPLPIGQMSLTFDQLGRPLVFYKVGSADLKLYWYDPVLEENVTISLTTGFDPVACFDFPQDAGQAFTDALLFYIRADVVYMRRQRDRFLVEYDTGVTYPGIRLESAGFNTDDSVQVIYIYPED